MALVSSERLQHRKIALTAGLTLTLTFILSCGEHDLEESLYFSSSSEDIPSSSSNVVMGSSSSFHQTDIILGPSVPYGDENYETVVIGTQTWFKRNLNYAVEGSKCIDDATFYNDMVVLLVDENSFICDIYGRLYTWEAAMTACPEGWHLPSDVEWDALVRYLNPSCSIFESSCLVDKILKATRGWENNTNGSDDYGFAALPAGAGKSIGEIASWWSSTEKDSNRAYNREILRSYGGLYRYDGNSKNIMMSVRCVKD